MNLPRSFVRFWITVSLFFTGAAQAVPIQSLSGLTSITFYEQTTAVFSHTFGVTSAEILTQRANPLSSSNRDFSNHGFEFYDVFYSDSDGTLNVNGAYISIEVRFDPVAGGGGNINGIELNFSGGATEFANSIASFAAFGAGSFPGAFGNAVDGDLGTTTSMGSTFGTTDRLRITVGFESSADVIPEPGAFAILGAGVAGLIFVRRRKQAA